MSSQPDTPRPRSAFAKLPADDTPRGKDGRKLGGFTDPEYSKEYWTPERKAEQSQRAKEMIAAGTFGAANGFHKRKTRKFQEIAAEHAQQHADEIVKKLDEMIFGQHKDKRLQLEAIREYMKMEAWAVQNSRDDEKEFRSMTNDQLEAKLHDMIGESLGFDFTLAAEDIVEDDDELVAMLESGEYDPLDREFGGDRLREVVAEEDDDE